MALLPKTAFAQSRRRVGRAAGITENIVPERAVPRAQAGQATFDASAIGRAQVQAADAYGRAGQAMGRAFSDVGGAVQAVSNRLEAAQLKQQEFEIRRRLQEFEFEQSNSLTDTLRDVEPGDVVGLQGSLTGSFAPRAKELVDSISDPVQQQFADNELTKIYNRLSGTAIKFAASEQLRVNELKIADHLNSVLGPEAGSPGVGLEDYKTIERKLHGVITSTPGLSPIEADKVWRKYGRELLQHYIQGNPNKAVALLGVQGEDAPETAKFLSLTDRKAIRSSVNSAVKETVSQATEFTNAGLEIPPQIQAQLLSYGASGAAGASADEIASALRQSAVIGDAYSLAPGDLQNRIDGLYASGVNTPEKLEAVQAYEKVFGNLQKAIEGGDLLDYAKKSGNFPVTSFDVENAYSMAQHRQNALAIADFYGVAPQLTNDGQRLEISSLLNDETKSASERVATMQQLATGLGQEVFAEISDEKYAPMMAHAGALAAMGRPDIAREILQGQAEIAEGRPGPGQRDDFETNFALATEGAFSTPEALKQGSLIFKTAKALYAARKGQLADQNTFDDELFVDAVADVLGTRQGPDGQVGGAGSYHGVGIILPSDLTQTQFSEIVSNLKDEDLTRISTSVPPMSAVGINRTPLGPVHADGSPMTVEDLQDFYLISVGNGEYEVSFDNPMEGPPRRVRAEGSNKPWRMRIDASLLNEAPQPVNREDERTITRQKRSRVTKAGDFASSELGRKIAPSGISLP